MIKETFSAVALLFSLSPAPATVSTAAPAPHCELQTGNTYLRTSGAKKVVGFKPKFTCSEPMDTISLTGQMFAIADGSPTARGDGPTSTNVGQVSVENRRIGFSCSDTTTTTWFGRATVSAVWHGIPQAATVDSPQATLSCGA